MLMQILTFTFFSFCQFNILGKLTKNQIDRKVGVNHRCNFYYVIMYVALCQGCKSSVPLLACDNAAPCYVLHNLIQKFKFSLPKCLQQINLKTLFMQLLFFTFRLNDLNFALEYRAAVQKFAALFNQSNWKRHTVSYGIRERAKIIVLRVGVEEMRVEIIIVQYRIHVQRRSCNKN